MLSEVLLIRKKARRKILQQEMIVYREAASRGVMFIFFIFVFFFLMIIVAVFGDKVNFQSADDSTCVAYIKTIIHFSGESGGYFPRLFRVG